MYHRSSHALLITAVALLAGCGQSDGSNGVGSSEAPNSSWAGSDAELSRLTLPKGFSIHLFAKELEGPRMMAIGPDKALYVSEPRTGKVVRLVDVDGDGHADSTADAATGLNRPHGLAWLGDTLWVANTDAVVKTWSTKGDGKLDGVRTVVDGLPAGGRHWTKTIHFPPTKNGAEPRYFFLATGSSCNVCEEDNPLRATISRWTIDGKPAGAKTLMNDAAARAMVHDGGKYADAVWAYGLRNSVDFGWEPSTGAMWAVHNGSDVLGKENQAITDSIPHEEVVNIIQEGGFYGWPYCYEDGKVSPLQEGATRALCQEQVAPALTDTAHSAPLGLIFYTGTQFPESYRGDEFITEHGSWNRSEPVGARVIHVNVENGKPQGLEAFITGWETADGKRWGRPVGIIVGPDGTMYISDDAGGRIYAIRWTGAAD